MTPTNFPTPTDTGGELDRLSDNDIAGALAKVDEVQTITGGIFIAADDPSLAARAVFDLICAFPDLIAQARAAEALGQRVKRLEEGLKPFAGVASQIRSGISDDGECSAALPVIDFRRADALLKEPHNAG